MTYARFLALFVLVPMVFVLVVQRRQLRTAAGPLALLLVVVYATTAVWDNAAVAMGLWAFDDARTWGLRIGWLPLEEYLFFGLQSVLTGAWAWSRLQSAFVAGGAR